MPASAAAAAPAFKTDRLELVIEAPPVNRLTRTGSDAASGSVVAPGPRHSFSTNQCAKRVMLKMNLDSSDFRTGHGGGMQIETAAMEMDGDPEVVWIATATGPFPDGGNPGELSVQLHAARRMSPLQTMRESVLPTHRNV